MIKTSRSVFQLSVFLVLVSTLVTIWSIWALSPIFSAEILIIEKQDETLEVIRISQNIEKLREFSEGMLLSSATHFTNYQSLLIWVCLFGVIVLFVSLAVCYYTLKLRKQIYNKSLQTDASKADAAE